MVDLNFDANSVEPSEKREYPQLPRAWYSAYIDESEMRDTKAKLEGRNDNAYLQLRFVLMDWADNEQMPLSIKPNGRKFFARLNINNSNKEAVEIAYRDLSAIGHAVGVTSISTSDLLHDKPLEIFLETTEYNGKPSNEIAAYRACNSGADASQMQKMADMNKSSATQESSGATGGSTPWS